MASNTIRRLPLLEVFGWTFLLVVVGEGIRAQEVKRSQVLNDGSFKFAAKTSFSCNGRAAGYYADVETGCQVYHMCDGLGRQFSYECPNTTLFQQRMLICDHWYMVNCSKAESNYAANLLIGQRDKPFVPEEENEVRTPRPDLLDRPYASAYNGEPFKFNFIKTNFPAPQNAIIFDRKTPGKVPPTKAKSTTVEIFEESASNHGLPIHWGTRYADENTEKPTESESPGSTALDSTTITLNTEEEELQSNKINERRDANEDETKDESRNTVRFASSENRTSKVVVSNGEAFNGNRANAKVPSIRYEPPFRTEEVTRRANTSTSKETLGAGFKPFESILNFNKKGNRKDYDFSNFFGRNESIRNTIPTTTSTVGTNTTPRSPRPGTIQFSSSFASPTTTRPTTRFTTTPRKPTFITSFSTTPRPITVVISENQPPKINTAKFTQQTPFSFSLRSTTSTTTTTTPRTVTKTAASSTVGTDAPKAFADPRESNRPPTTIVFNAPAATAGLFENRFAFQRPPVEQVNVPIPSRDLLPPFPNVANFDKIKTQFVSQPVFTRQPITNEPSAGPITSGIDKLVHNEAAIEVRQDTVPRPFSVPKPSGELLPPHKDYVYYDDSTTKGPPIYYQWKWSIPSFGLDPPLDAPLTDEEKLLTQLNPASLDPSYESNREHNQTARSISSETGNPGENNATGNTIAESNKRTIQLPEHNYLELRKKLAIPNFTFPLESEVSPRGTYEYDGAVNSFQIKIPAYARSDDVSPAWYGENSKCPECHPTFLRPGSCEPCVKIRR
ncbi:mucin-2 [Toxorhynchites rutilus septentrionalis]|uniref:mucin-2 n=1 Tax=Toxorhynchites rutilus septentrionalis TaxID=329112 RepID=UPI002479972A|nr:mucin-2 [Toxorhynchites rutilus septentrionalis]